MKKLMALLVVAGMVFIGCNNQPTEEPIEEEIVEAEIIDEADAMEEVTLDEVAEEAEIVTEEEVLED